MARFDPKKATAHVEKLARTNNVMVHWRKGKVQEAHESTSQIWVTPIKRQIDYLEALHEIGHIVDPTCRATNRSAIPLSAEGGAWEWAMWHVDPDILPRLSDATRRHIQECWGSYVPKRL